MAIEALGHNFRPYGQEEMLCSGCGYVIWRVVDSDQALAACLMIGGGDWSLCGNRQSHRVPNEEVIAIG